jgi:hypothetical protein
MKVPLATLTLALAAAAPASAQSFVMLERAATQPSPSIVLFVEPKAAPALAGDRPEVAATPAPRAAPATPSFARLPLDEHFVQLSASVVAMGEPEVETSMVASITPEPKPMRNPHLPPMVIRGGLSGEAFVRGNGMGVAPAADPLAAGGPAGASPAGGKPAPGGQKQPEPPRAPPPPQPQAPASPTRLPE